ncbi:MAG: penicillin-binding protein 2, partial [Lachnospiraceae bacterium]|nr:penicillin-binding protein 2 [Lachnospiraceae bacterium]
MSKKSEKKKNTNKSGVQVFLTAMVFALIFLAMIGNLVLFQMKESDVAYTNSYNSKRVEAVKAETTRGTIYASSGEVLAESKNDENGEEVRDYPYGSLFAHTVGYEKEGASGIEKSMQQYLIRSDISLDEKLKNDLADKKDQGNSVYTSLDPAIQQIAYNSLGDYRGAVVVTEVKTGKIIAMVSKPDFDPGAIEENWDQVSSDIE